MDAIGALPPEVMFHNLSLSTQVQIVLLLELRLNKALRPVLRDLGPLLL
jgi:hypothetical protein